MKKIAKIVSLCLLVCIALSVVLAFTACQPQDQGKNLIYIIGDGMGTNHIKNTKLHLGATEFAFDKYYVGDVTTRSASDSITDSAAAATALATGTKTNNKNIGVDPNGEELKNIMELSKDKGRRTGIVTTDTLDGATPAGFSAHTDRRTDSYGIIQDQIKGVVDLLIGKYSSSYRLNRNDFGDNGYAYCETYGDLMTYASKQKVVGNIKDLDSPYDPNLENAVSLKSAVEYALSFLTSNKEGAFTLMIEGAYIDKHSHNNDITSMIYAMMDLNDTVEYVLDWASKRDDTIVIFTADHETGGLNLAENKEAISHTLYTSDDHTATNVPLYLYNIATALEQIDNTDVYKIAESVVLNNLPQQAE